MLATKHRNKPTHVSQKVILNAELKIVPGLYAFYESPVADFPARCVANALAFVRDEDVWSILAPANSLASEKFVLFCFHFPERLDNSGFVGWLATHLKAKVGSGVLVVCGQNSKRGGIFDYWGAPESVSAQVIAEVEGLPSGRGLE